MANFRNIGKFEMGITNWKNLPTMDLVTKALVFNSPNDETFETRLVFASEMLDYTKSVIDAIRVWRKNYIQNIELGMPK